MRATNPITGESVQIPEGGEIPAGYVPVYSVNVSDLGPEPGGFTGLFENIPLPPPPGPADSRWLLWVLLVGLVVVGAVYYD